MDWSVCIPACIGAFIGMGIAILAFGRPVVVNITMPRPIVEVHATDNYKAFEAQQ